MWVGDIIVHTTSCYWCSPWASLVAPMVKNPPAMQETWIWSLGREVPLEKGMATHSSVLAWRIPWTEEPDGLQSMGSQRVRHDWATKHTCSPSSESIFPACAFHCTIHSTNGNCKKSYLDYHHFLNTLWFPQSAVLFTAFSLPRNLLTSHLVGNLFIVQSKSQLKDHPFRRPFHPPEWEVLSSSFQPL